MPTVAPARDMKDAAAFSALVEREHDATVARNGYKAFHCPSTEEWVSQRDEAAKAKLLSRIMIAEREIANGEYEDYDTFAARIKAAYGL